MNVFDKLPITPLIHIEKSLKRSFNQARWNELGLASMESSASYIIYALEYPSGVWAQIQVLESNKAFFDENMSCYVVHEKNTLVRESSLARDDEIRYYFSVTDNLSFCRAIHEKCNTQNPEVTYYKDGPTHHLQRR